jgi:hypothetical protein
MTRLNRILQIAAMAVLISSCGGGNHGDGGGTSWTLLVYMAADNNLSGAAAVDLSEMEAVGSKNGINVVVQVDGSDEGARRLLIEKGSSSLLMDLGEVNMADPKTLTEFIQWGVAEYPADRTVLILWSHGDGYQKPDILPVSRPQPYSILEDDTDGVSCCLSNVSVHQAIQNAGIHFDLLGFDASRMGQVETAYEFSDVADVLVFSEETGNENGWDYKGILKGLAGDPGMTPADLSKWIVQTFGDFYEDVYYPANPGVEQNLTISAVHLGERMDNMVGAVDDLAIQLKAALDSPTKRADTLSAVADAREATQGFVSLAICPEYADLFDFVDQLRQEPNLDLNIEMAAVGLKAKSAVLAEYHGQDRPGASGISIVFYKTADSNCSNFDPAYLSGTSPVAFVAITHWDEFLTTYYTYQGSLP